MPELNPDTVTHHTDDSVVTSVRLCNTRRLSVCLSVCLSVYESVSSFTWKLL